MISSYRSAMYWLIIGFVMGPMLVLTACGGENGAAKETSAPASTETEVAAPASKDTNAEEDYKNEVRAQMRRSKKRSMVGSYGISEEQADCLLDNLSTAQLMTAQSDPEVQAVIEKCGVDPAVVK
jgi:hypothetical protein